MLHNYDSNILFTYFLYPIIDKNTILEIDDSDILKIIFSYLKDVCNVIFESIKTTNIKSHRINFNADGYILDEVLLWPASKQTSQVRDYRIVNYLKNTFKWDWINSNKISFNHDKNFIEISNPLEPKQIIRLLIDTSKDEANLMVDGKEIDKFVIKSSRLFLKVCKKTEKKKYELYSEHIKMECDKHKQIFLANLRNQSSSNSKWKEILSKDTGL